MGHEVVFTDTAIQQYLALKARWRASVKAAIEKHLRHEPQKVSGSRIKRLRDMEHPQYRLRVENHRVFYDMDGRSVVVLAIVPKDASEEWLSHPGVKSS